MNRIPLLNGHELDTDSVLSTHPHVLSVTHPSLGALPDDASVFHEDFSREQLPWWLTYATDNGPATPSFDGLASGNDNTHISLSTGTTSSGDATALQFADDAGTPQAINWDNWSAMHIFARFESIPDGAGTYLTYSDDKDPSDSTDNIKMISRRDLGSLYARVYDGSTQNDAEYRNTTPNTMGVSVYEGESGNGHTLEWWVDGERHDRWTESGVWVSSTAHQIAFGIVTQDTASDKTAIIDEVLIVLVP